MDDLDKKKSFMIYLFLIVFLVAVIFYFVFNKDDIKNTAFIGEGVCGNFDDGKLQDICCKEMREGDDVTLCDGVWRYISGISQCQYVCLKLGVSCPEDLKTCDNGEVVSRDSDNECEFYECES
jgi:hypothetical protein